MTEIRIKPEQVDEFSKKFVNSSNQVQDLLNQVQNLVNTLQGGQFTGNRANKFYNNWGAMKPQIVKAIQTLNQAGQILKEAAIAFAGTDNQG